MSGAAARGLVDKIIEAALSAAEAENKLKAEVTGPQDANEPDHKRYQRQTRLEVALAQERGRLNGLREAFDVITLTDEVPF